jgi:allantoinase
MTRDFVGYGPTPPHANWPGGARIAVNFVINFEEGSELSYPADGISEGGLTEAASVDPGMSGRRDLGAESMFEYGARVGWWRLHRIFTKYRVPGDPFRLRQGARSQPAGSAGDRRDRLGHLRSRLSLDQAL